MRSNSLIAASIFLAALLFPTSAQQAHLATATAQAAPAGASAAGSVGDAKIALIDTAVFSDPKAGITRYVNAVNGVNREFQAQETQLQTMRASYQKLVDEVNKTKDANVADPKSLQVKVEQAESLRKDIERKSQDAREAYEKRLREVLAPIYQDIGKNIDAFAKGRGISIVLDSGKLAEAGVILMASDSIDITRAFIAEYNSKNPGTASVR